MPTTTPVLVVASGAHTATAANARVRSAVTRLARTADGTPLVDSVGADAMR